MSKLFHLSLFIIAVTTSVSAQQVLTIQVTDKQSGEVLPFANIYLVRNGGGSTTDLAGQATVQLPKAYVIRDTLLCSYIGYRDTAIYVDFSSTSFLEVSLEPEIVQLQEVTVKQELSSITGNEIIEKVLKRIKDNYSRRTLELDGFYRETVYENDVCVEVNEAIVKLNYTRYPRKRYVKRSFRKYYSDSYYFRYTRGGGLLFGHPQYFKYYNTVNDEAEILASRTSDYLGEGLRVPAPRGGPLAMTALDKVKYLSDFLDKKLIDEYYYKKTGAAYIDDRLCYAINFYPSHQDKHVFQHWNKKMKFAVYSGTIFVDVDNFSVVKINCRFAEHAKLDIYRGGSNCLHFPQINDLTIEYSGFDGMMCIKRVKSEQVIFPEPERLCVKVAHKYRCTRELTIQSVGVASDKKKYSASDPNLLKDIQYANLRDFPSSYDEEGWEKYLNEGKYIPLSEDDLKQLEREEQLSKQFRKRFVQEDIEVPKAAKIPDTSFLLNEYMQIDEYSYMDDLANSYTQDYIKQENRYFNNFFIPFKTQFYSTYHSMTHSIKRCSDEMDGSGRRLKIGFASSGEYGLVEYDSTGEHTRLLVNFSEDGIDRSGLKSALINRDRSKIALIVKGEKKERLYIKDFHLRAYIDTIHERIDDAFWFNDSVLCFTVLDDTDRVSKMFQYDTKTMRKQLLVETPGKEYEIEFTYTQRGALIINSRNFCDNSFYYLAKSDDATVLRLTDYSDLNGERVNEDSLYLYLLASENGGKVKLFRRSKALEEAPWECIITPDEGVLFDDFILKGDYVLVRVIQDAQFKLYCFPKQGGIGEEIPLPEVHHSVDFSYSQSSVDEVDFYYSSPNIPERQYVFHPADQSLSYTTAYCYEEGRPENRYATKVFQIKTKDGAEVPMRVTAPDGKSFVAKGVVLKVYGAYGAFLSAGFDEYEQFLMDKGYAVAVAHVRGSRVKGYQWYESGKGLLKENSIYDYIECAKYLIKAKLYSTDKLIAYGQSAGGLVIGAAINKFPELFAAAIFDYPYLDVISTMTNEDLYLTTTEYCEWGNPNDKSFYEYIHGYSPYQNIAHKAYPPMLFMSGLQDQSTPYWQVIKSAAKYRSRQTGDAKILVHVADGKHPGNIPYNQRMKEMKYQYFFMENSLK